MRKGFLAALAFLAVASACTAGALSQASYASPELLRNMANVGAALVLAYVVQITWTARRSSHARDRTVDGDIGFAVGAGVAGFLGVVAALLTAEHRAAGHANLLDVIGTSWAAVSLLILGITVTLEPWIVHWATRGSDDEGGI